jgi:hypothetical protein
VALNIHLPGFFRATGRIVDGVMRFHGLGPDRPEFTYRVTGEMLSGTYKNEGHVRLTRVADVRQVGCGRRDGELPPAPSASGPRDRLTAAELWAPGKTGTGPVHTAYFLPVGQAAPALHAFQGTLTVQAPTLFRARHGCAGVAELLLRLLGRLLHSGRAPGAGGSRPGAR